MIIKQLTLITILLLSACSVVREDIVFSERYTESPCEENLACSLNSNIITLNRERIVTAGIARNSVGTLRPECEADNNRYICVTSELVIPKSAVLKTETAKMLNRIKDGYDSNRTISDAIGFEECKVFNTVLNQNQSYLTIISYEDFSSILKNETKIENKTGGPLVDYTEATLVCSNECSFDVENNQTGNLIKILLSKSTTSGRLPKEEIRKKQKEIEDIQNACSAH